MLPQSAAEVDFDGAEGKLGWSKYKLTQTFEDYNGNQVYDAAKVGLGDAGFSVLKADKAQGYVMGEHGITLHDWNVIAGVYFKPVETGTAVAVVIEGSKDIGFSGDVTGDGWAGKILKAMRDYLSSKHQLIPGGGKKAIEPPSERPQEILKEVRLLGSQDQHAEHSRIR